MRRFKKLENKNFEPLKPKCNLFCFFLSSSICIILFLLGFFIPKNEDKQEISYEFQAKPLLYNENDFIHLFSNYSDFEFIEKIQVLQKSYKSIHNNYKMEDAMIKYRSFSDGKKDLSLKIKDLFKENINQFIIKTNHNFKHKNKIEINYHWKQDQNIYSSWQQTSKVYLSKEPILETINDVKEYFPNAEEIFMNNEFFENYNQKKLIIYKYNFIQLKTVLDIIFEYDENNVLQDLSIEYKLKDNIIEFSDKIFDYGVFFMNL